ncbi:MAG: 4Fe-4S binding protein [Syntrophomonadaceae bacterium]|jgi:2-oxoglutarate ferredoxin oxidoreductase subunit delta
MAKGQVIINSSRCKACEICVAFCPQKILGLDRSFNNVLGYTPVTMLKPDKCTGCGMCALMCPDLVIKVERI